jgi:hypothetical protein
MKLCLSRKILLGLMALLLPATLALAPGKQAVGPHVPIRKPIQKHQR